MLLTLLLSLVMMIGLFLIILSAVALIQDKKVFSSAPKDIQEAIIPREERFRGARIIGYVVMILAMLSLGVAVLVGAIDGIKNGYSFVQYLIRFLIMVWVYKLFDIFFIDWVLLCHSGFYPHFFPEVKELVGPEKFGFNKKSHIIQSVVLTVGSVVLACVCALVW